MLVEIKIIEIIINIFADRWKKCSVCLHVRNSRLQKYFWMRNILQSGKNLVKFYLLLELELNKILVGRLLYLKNKIFNEIYWKITLQGEKKKSILQVVLFQTKQFKKFFV